MPLVPVPVPALLLTPAPASALLLAPVLIPALAIAAIIIPITAELLTVKNYGIRLYYSMFIKLLYKALKIKLLIIVIKVLNKYRAMLK